MAKLKKNPAPRKRFGEQLNLKEKKPNQILFFQLRERVTEAGVSEQVLTPPEPEGAQGAEAPAGSSPPAHRAPGPPAPPRQAGTRAGLSIPPRVWTGFPPSISTESHQHFLTKSVPQ